MEAAYSELAQRYAGSHVRIAKFQADVEREFSTEQFGLKTFPTIVVLPKGRPGFIKYPSENRTPAALDMWLKTVAAGYQ
jgi:adenylyl-sulfate reductase (glutathione)